MKTPIYIYIYIYIYVSGAQEARPPRRTPADLRRRILSWVDGVTPPAGEVEADQLVLFRSNRHDGRLFQRVDRELLGQLG